MTRAMTKTVECGCGKKLVIASGYNAEAMPFERMLAIASAAGWWISPLFCPECRLKHNSLPPIPAAK